MYYYWIIQSFLLKVIIFICVWIGKKEEESSIWFSDMIELMNKEKIEWRKKG